jgi:RHS repeat-associated protein
MTSQTRYYHYDGLGSTQLLTDENGNVTDSYCNTAFGEPVSTGAANPTVNPFRYVGREGYYLDADTGQYYVRARTYSPVLARWLSADLLALAARDANLYRYVRSSATNATDPSGLAGIFTMPLPVPSSTVYGTLGPYQLTFSGPNVMPGTWLVMVNPDGSYSASQFPWPAGAIAPPCLVSGPPGSLAAWNVPPGAYLVVMGVVRPRKQQQTDYGGLQKSTGGAMNLPSQK